MLRTPHPLLLTLAFAGFCLTQGSQLMAEDRNEGLARSIVTADRVLVIGHRGACAAAPENTLASFRLALEAKPDMVELDYYHSSDGVPFVFHDKDLDRTTNAIALWGKKKLAIDKVAWAELSQLDAGSWFAPQFAGTRIPTLAESIDTIQSGSVTLIERKGGDAATVVKLLAEKKLLERVVVQAFDWDYLRDCHRLAPELPLGALGSKTLGPEQIKQIQTTGASAVGWKWSDIGPAEVKRVHAAGLKLWVYTVNEPADMRKLIALGVDGLITDKPALARQVVAQIEAQ